MARFACLFLLGAVLSVLNADPINQAAQNKEEVQINAGLVSSLLPRAKRADTYSDVYNSTVPTNGTLAGKKQAFLPSPPTVTPDIIDMENAKKPAATKKPTNMGKKDQKSK